VVKGKCGNSMNNKLQKLQSILPVWIFLISITIGQAQDTFSIPDFSVERGFYESPFEVVISSDTENASIVYTLDGSDPTTSQNAFTETSPATVYIDPDDETERFTAPGVILRAIATLDTVAPSRVVTHTFLFLNKIADLSPHEQKPGAGWPERNMNNSDEQYMDYGLDPDVLNDFRYQGLISDSFFSLPSISLVTDLANLFDPDSGIYVNALKHGELWERPASLELLNPDESPGFHINAGLRIRGGWGRRNENPKHAFRLFFRGEYGSDELRYPLFGDEGVDVFDKIDLRTSQNYSWAAEGSNRNTLVREVLSRDIQRDMDQPYTRSRYYHLYLNGRYWGIYQTQERSEASYAEAYFGGFRDDYDVIKVDIGENLDLYEIEATDGNLDAYQRLWEMASNGFVTDEAYYKVEGKNPDGTRNPEYEVLLDLDNLIDYMLCTYYVSDGDGPLNGNQKPNNFYAVYNRNNPQGFKFFRHDGEHALFDHNGNLTGSVTGGEEFRHFNPRWLQQRLAVHPEYRLRYADRVYKHFFNDGACIDERSINRLHYRKNQVFLAIIAHSARWGDSISETPRTFDNDWLPAVNFMLNDFFPGRTEIVINQFRDKNWYPEFDPPQFNLQSGVISPGTEVTISSPVGTIYYTMDGTDPRLPESVFAGGIISPNAIEYSSELEINKTTEIKTRTLHDGEWSALNEISFTIPQGYDNLKVTEIHYHPTDSENVNDRELEFIELKNMGNSSVRLDGLNFFRGIEYNFASESQLAPDKYIVLASNVIEFEKRYGFTPFGEYLGQLANNGETISLKNVNNDTLISIMYDDNYPWPNSADGDGYSLVLREENVSTDLNNAKNWHASKSIHGSPGRNDEVTVITRSDNLPSKFHLSQNYPNPFNPTTIINYELPITNFVELSIYNILGQKVATLVYERQPAGTYQVEWDASRISSGLYFYILKSGEIQDVKKMILIK
jgi:hypothetical protein